VIERSQHSHTPGLQPGRAGVPFVDLAAQYRTIQPEIDAAIAAVLQRCDFVLGRDVDAFEQAFAGFIGVPHAIGVSNGLDALRLTLLALDIGPNDEVVVPANSYIATALAVSAVGARPVLVDCEPQGPNLDLSRVEAAITPRTRALMPVHLTGQPIDMDAVALIARRHALPVIEDAAQAHGAEFAGRRCGSLGIAGCFSFYPGKNLGAYGDGGMVTTYDTAVAERIRSLRNYGQRIKYDHVEKGVNARLDTIQAAVLTVKLPHLQRWNAARAAHAALYRQRLASVGDLVLSCDLPKTKPVHHLFTIETAHRTELAAHLLAVGIQTGIHYPVPIHLQPAYADLGYAAGDFPHAERLARRTLSLPMFPELTEPEIELVVREIRCFFAGRDSCLPPGS